MEATSHHWPDFSRSSVRLIVVESQDGRRRLMIIGNLSLDQKRYLHGLGYEADANGYLVCEKLDFSLKEIELIFPYLEVVDQDDREIGYRYEDVPPLQQEIARRLGFSGSGREADRSRAVRGDSMSSGIVGTSMSPLLTIDLVPESAWFNNVRANIPAIDWGKLKRLYFTRAGQRCEICSERGSDQGEDYDVELHEVWEYDDRNHTQTLIEMVVLCPCCHRVKHMGLAEATDQGPQAMARLARINGWNLEQAKRYRDKCFLQWRDRSKVSWQLDVTFLDRYGITVIRKEGSR